MCSSLTGCAVSSIHVFKRKAWRQRFRRKTKSSIPDWAVTGMRLTFRAELMPGRDAGERTFTVARVLASGRVELVDMGGQHGEQEFESAAR